MKSKATISTKIEQKQEGMLLPKNSEVKLKYTYSHPIAYGIHVPEKSNKYSIKVESSDKADSSLLDPTWYDASWGYSKKLTITENNATTLTNYNVNITIDTATLISAGKLQADCDDLRFTDVTNTTVLDYYIDSLCNTANTLVWLEVPSLPASSATVIYMYYGNAGASRGSTSNAFSTWDLVYLCNEATGTSIADASPINDSGSMTNGYWETVNPKFGNSACAVNQTDNSQYLTYSDVFDSRNAVSATVEAWFYVTA
jgi:hypothetical protein